MAGSYNHAVDDQGRLLHPRHIGIAAENPDDAYETIEEFYGMIWFLAEGNPALVLEAHDNYQRGLEMSPGTHAELPDDD